MRVLACGSRGFGDAGMVRAAFRILADCSDILDAGGRQVVVIEGGAKGADTLARKVAEEFGFEVEEYPADWELHGRAAGVIRNQLMLDNGKPDIVLAFAIDIPLTPGTADMVRRARKEGLPVQLYLSHETSE